MARKKTTQGSLSDYQAKRDFAKSPEPATIEPSGGRAADQALFVVHRHDARNLHFDLRVEMEGVLKSWAVPKGFSFNPRDKHLAVQTEDHPLEYQDFHGVIPSGQYGAGTMTIWDRGTYQLPDDKDGVAAIESGKLEVQLDGARLRGEWHMVRMKGENNQWLLFKAKDKFARGENEPAFALDLALTDPCDLPETVEPMQATRPRQLTTSGLKHPADWVFEPILVGRRAQVIIKGSDIRVGCDGQDVSGRTPGIIKDIGRLRCDQAILDGFLVCLDEQNIPSETLITRALSGQSEDMISFYAFDLLFYQRWDLREFALRQRKAALASIIPQLRTVAYVDHERDQAVSLVETAHHAGLPGVMARRSASQYTAGRSKDWLELSFSDSIQPTEIIQHISPTYHSIAARAQKFTNQRKILWPREGFTKGDLIDFYEQVSGVMIPHLEDRPLSINRFPNGIYGESFFQKDAPKHTPDWVPTAVVSGSRREDKQIRFILGNDARTLLYLANLAAMELHPFMSRCQSLDSPDWAVIDLDPYGVEFRHVITVAQAITEILQEAGLKFYLKTSGSKGLHIYIPLAAGYSYEQGRMFCEGVANLTVTRHRKIATVERVRSQRVGMIYIDCLQNHRGQTVVAPYAVRPVPGGTVSTPFAVDELADLDPQTFTLETVGKRIESYGDLFEGVLENKQHLDHAIDRILEMARA